MGRLSAGRGRTAASASLLLCGLLAGAVVGHTALACQAPLRARVSLTRAEGVFMLPVAVNGVTLSFVLDTGAERSVLSLQAADQVRLARDEWVSTDLRGAGGQDRRRLGRPRSLTLGGIALRRRTVAADTSLVVGPLPTGPGGQAIAGLLGQDYLSAFDLDIDAAGQTLALYDPAGCNGSQVVPWPGRTTTLPATRPVRTTLVLPVRVAGQALAAELDTGAAISTLLAPGAVRLGLAPGGSDVVRGFGPGSARARRQDFTVQVSGLPPRTVSLLVTTLWALRSVDMLLGADWLAQHRIWVSWAANQVVVAD